MKLQEAFEEFIISRRLKGLAPKSIVDYTNLIKPLIRFFGSDYQIEELSKEEIDKFVLTLYDKDLATASIATYIRNNKIFLKWLEANYSISVSAKNIIIPKVPKKLVKIYSDKEIGMILKAVVSKNKWLTARNRAMVFLMLDSGLRQNEVCTLLRKNIDFERHIMKVIGKGNKERHIYFGKTVGVLLRQYIELMPYYESEFMFVNRFGEPLTTDSIKHLVARIAKRLPFEFSSHKLRHNFATNYCIDQYEKHGRIDIYMLMNLMGHEDIETTMIYLHHAMGMISASSDCSHIDSIDIELL